MRGEHRSRPPPLPDLALAHGHAVDQVEQRVKGLRQRLPLLLATILAEQDHGRVVGADAEGGPQPLRRRRVEGAGGLGVKVSAFLPI